MEFKVTLHDENDAELSAVTHAYLEMAVNAAKRYSTDAEREARVWAKLETGWRLLAVYSEGYEVTF